MPIGGRLLSSMARCICMHRDTRLPPTAEPINVLPIDQILPTLCLLSSGSASACDTHRAFCAGATDAARGAADIVLTKPGLSAIVSAIIGARKIFQRMTTFTKYTVAMTFRVCFTFGLLTVIYNWWDAWD